jgi:uncharacterized protein (DUF1697 family)
VEVLHIHGNGAIESESELHAREQGGQLSLLADLDDGSERRRDEEDLQDHDRSASAQVGEVRDGRERVPTAPQRCVAREPRDDEEPDRRTAARVARGPPEELRVLADAGEAGAPGAMTRYALLLRGVNVGKKNSLPMAELRAMLTNLGCTDVQTYVQSGNAVFGTNVGTPAIKKAIEYTLERYMGRPIATTIRTLEQMKAIVDGNPFANVATNPAYLCVTFLSNALTKSELAPLHALDWKPELFKVAGREIYTWHPNGQGRSPLAAALGKLPLHGAITTRNWNTVLKLLEMLSES